MSDNLLTKILAAPFALLFGVGVSLRKWAYSAGVLKGLRFDFPIISVGNLNVGGTGKSPHVEFLVRYLHQYLEIAVISRGYKRKTQGFRYVQPSSTATEVGDEPLQFKQKFADVTVAVAESRAAGIIQLIGDNPSLQTIIMDDAFQHLAIQAGLNILLTAYNDPFTKDEILPIGRLREWRNGYQRADIIIVTKCPTTLNLGNKLQWQEEIRLLPHQRLYFSHFRYGRTYYLFNPTYQYSLTVETSVLFISGIADTAYLEFYLENNVRDAELMRFPDHHFFTNSELGNLKKRFEALENPQKIILTTEKDATRLRLHEAFLVENRLPIFVLPIEVDFLFDEKTAFEVDIQQFLMEFKV